jgi:CPA2 family monovalent cation:H+ antiporter-2
MAQYALPVIVITLAVVLGQVVSCAFGAFVAGNDTRTSLRVGMGLAQIGEFSFIIASLGVTLGVTSRFLYPIAVTVSALTTLLNPYLIRNADAVVNWFDRVAPPRFVNCLALYTRWVGQWREGRHTSMASRLTRHWTWQMALNCALVAGIFIAATFVARTPPVWMPKLPGDEEGLKAALWLVAALLSLPLLIATYRKLQALGLLLGEMAAERRQNETRAAGVQAVIAHTVPLAGAICLGLLLLVLSTALLPSWRILFLLLLVVAGVTVLLWRGLIQVYSKAQSALEETFARPPHPRIDPPAPLAGLLQEAEIESVAVSERSPAKGKLIRELALRTQTGASIVAIERAGATLVNPGPDEELQTNDQVLLLGKREQLDAARRLLADHGPDSAHRTVLTPDDARR